MTVGGGEKNMLMSYFLMKVVVSSRKKPESFKVPGKYTKIPDICHPHFDSQSVSCLQDI